MAPIELQNLTDRELLIQTITVVNGMNEALTKVMEDGLPRCKMHQEKVQNLGKKVGTLTKAAYGVAALFVTDLVHRVVV